MIKEEIIKNSFQKDSFGYLIYTQFGIEKAMQEFADQEKEKVAVAFAERKDSNVRFVFHNKIKYNLRNSETVFDTLPDLYQYFINNVYNQNHAL